MNLGIQENLGRRVLKGLTEFLVQQDQKVVRDPKEILVLSGKKVTGVHMENQVSGD